ncbi:MAG: hypothetical protein AB7E77_09825 [Desulfobulbus sp.]
MNPAPEGCGPPSGGGFSEGFVMMRKILQHRCSDQAGYAAILKELSPHALCWRQRCLLCNGVKAEWVGDLDVLVEEVQKTHYIHLLVLDLFLLIFKFSGGVRVFFMKNGQAGGRGMQIFSHGRLS